MQSLPFSLAFVSSGSRGTRLLFYTRGRKRAEGNYGGLGKRDVIHELPPTTLAEILAPSSIMIGNKFKLSVDQWNFIGHSFSVQSHSLSIAFNVVFVFKSSCSPETIWAYDHLSHMIGSAIVHEEEKCGYLREQVGLLMQLLEEADIPDPSAGEIAEASSLARSLLSILSSLQDGRKHIQVCINSWAKVNTLVAPSHVPVPPPTPSTASQPHVRSYSALLLYESPTVLISSLPLTCNPAMHRLLQVVSPMKSLQDVSLDADIPLGQTLRMAAHLVGWGRGIPIYPLSESNMYISSPTSDPRVSSRLAHQFSQAFCGLPASPSLPEVLSHFSLPISLGDIKESISDERIVEMAVWLLQHKQVIQLHTYVYIVPTTPIAMDSVMSPSLLGRVYKDITPTPFTGNHRKISDSDSTKSSDGIAGMAKWEELMAHLSPEERRSIFNTSAAADEDDLEEFARLSRYFHGDHHLEGIMLMENIPRSRLLTLIDKFSEVLVTCTLPEHTLTTIT